MTEKSGLIAARIAKFSSICEELRAGSGCKYPAEESAGDLGLNCEKKGKIFAAPLPLPLPPPSKRVQKKKTSRKFEANRSRPRNKCCRLWSDPRDHGESGRGHQRHRHQTKKNPLKTQGKKKVFLLPFSLPSVCVCECVCVRVCVCVSAYVCEGCESAVDFLRWNRKPSRHRRILWREANTGKSSSSSTKTTSRNNDGGHRAALVRVPWIILRR